MATNNNDSSHLGNNNNDNSEPSIQLNVEEPEETEAPLHYLEQAYAQTVDRFAADMPWIMHGSGDVEPTKVNPAAAHFLASLTAQYTAKLVNTAVDTFDMFLNQGSNVEPFRVPPPRFPQHRLPAPPQPLVERDPPDTPIIMTQGNERKPPRKKPKRKMRQDYWDEPLPMPKIRKKTGNSTSSTSRQQQKDSDKEDNDDDDDDPPIPNWVGAIGVDWHADSVRRAHMPLGLSAPNFIFPICHDVYAYGKVRHIQAAKRGSVDPLLQDSHVQDILQEEKLSRFKVGAKKDSNKGSSGGGEESVQEVATDPPSWPDIDSLLLPGFKPDLSFAKFE